MPPAPPTARNQVTVKRYDINLTLHDILTPLAQVTHTPGPQLDPHVAQLRDLASTMKDVVDRIDGIDPTVLAPKRL